MFEISDLFGILPKLDILQVFYLFLSDDEVIFALFIGSCELLLEMFHLLDEGFFVFETLLEDRVFLFFSLEVELQQNLVLLN